MNYLFFSSSLFLADTISERLSTCPGISSLQFVCASFQPTQHLRHVEVHRCDAPAGSVPCFGCFQFWCFILLFFFPSCLCKFVLLCAFMSLYYVLYCLCFTWLSWLLPVSIGLVVVVSAPAAPLKEFILTFERRIFQCLSVHPFFFKDRHHIIEFIDCGSKVMTCEP